MIDFKPRNNKHGWRRVKNNIPTVFGFKSRRNFLDKFEGNRLGMRKLVNAVAKDYRNYNYPKQHEAVLTFLWSHIGDYYDDVLSEFCKKTNKYRQSMMISPRSRLNNYLGLTYEYYYSRYMNFMNGLPVGSYGFYVDSEGKIQVLPNFIGGCKNYKVKKRKKSLEHLYRYNEENIIIPDIETLKTKSIIKIGSGYVTDLKNNIISNKPLKVYIIEKDRFDISDSNGKIKDLMYLQSFRPVFILGRKTNEQYIRYINGGIYYRSRYFIFAVKNENRVI